MAKLIELLKRLARPLLALLPERLIRITEARKHLQPAHLIGHAQALRQQALNTYREGGLRAFFGPGIRLLNARRYTWKFGLLGALALLTTGIYVLSLNIIMRNDINTARNEARALSLYPPLLQVLHDAHQYSLHAWAAGSDPALSAGLAARAAGVDNSLKNFDTLLTRQGDRFKLGTRWAGIKSDWQKLKAADATPNVEQIKTLHPKFGRQILDLIGDLGEASGLLADEQRASNLLADLLIRKIPHSADRLAALSQTSVLLLGSKDMSGDWLRMAALTSDAERSRDALFDALQRSASANPASKSTLEAALPGLQSSWSALLEITDREIRKGGFGMSGEAFMEAARPPADALLAQAAPLTSLLQKQLEARADTLENRFWTASALGAVLVMLLIYFSLGMFLTILGSVQELSKGAQHIGEGDLSYRIQYSARDELHGVASQFNQMAGAFAGIIAQVQHTSSELGQAAKALAASAGEVAQSSEQQSEAAASMAAAVEEMTVGIDEISRSASSADEVAVASGEQSQSGGEVVARTVAEMEQIADAVRQSANVITELGRNSSQISGIVKSIKEIANQTNLLALNASIEAARAGEDGRGFAVVADEVRKLAERTTRATAEIGEMVTSIQAGTTRAVAAMQDGVRRVQGGVDLSNQAGIAMQQIREESARVLNSVSEISSALREQAAASSDIAHSVESIAQMAETNHAQVDGTRRTAEELVDLSTRLSAEVRRFRI